MLFRTSAYEVFSTAFLSFFLSSLALAQPNNTNKLVAAKRSTAISNPTTTVNAIPVDGRKRFEGFNPVVIYYRTTDSGAVGNRGTDGARVTALRASAEPPSTPRGSATKKLIPPASTNATLSFQPVTIQYRLYGRPALDAPSSRNAAPVATGNLTEKPSADLNAGKVEPTPAVAEPIAQAPAILSNSVTPSVEIQARAESKPTLPEPSNQTSDQPVPGTQKDSAQASNEAEIKPTSVNIAPAEQETEQTTIAAVTDPAAEAKDAGPAVAQPEQQAEAATLDVKNKTSVSDEVPETANLAASQAATNGGSPLPDTAFAERIIKSSEDPVALNNAAVRMTLDSRYEEAIEALKRAAELVPTQSKFLRNLSVVYERINRMDEAIAAAQRSVDLAPRESAALIQLCGLKVMAGRNGEAVGCFETLAGIKPLDADSQAFYGIALLRSGEDRKAVFILESVAERAPENVGVLNALGLAYFNLNKYSEAAQWFKRAVEVDPKHGELRFNLAIAQAANKNKEAGMSQYRILKEEHPKLAEELYQILFQDRVVHMDALKKH